MMIYEGYIGDVEYDGQAFHDSVDEYVSCCTAEEIPLERPYSGTFNLCLSLELYRYTSINAFVEKAIEDELRAVKS